MAKVAINVSKGALQTNELDEIIIGIDLGTTNSLVAYMDKCSNVPVCIKQLENSSLLPSVIYFDPLGKIEVGANAKEKLITHPNRTLFSIKRLMGRSFKDVLEYKKYFAYPIIDDNKEGLLKVNIDNKYYSPIELSAILLKELKNIAEKTLKQPIEKAVITVPAYFNDAQRQATKDAGKLAGLNVLRIINEPTAASLAYGLGNIQSTEQTVAVYDLGGGTFDISILNIHPDNSGGIFEVLATHGDTFLGGDDFDNAIIDYWQAQYQINLQDDNGKLRVMAESAKKYLTNHLVFEAIYTTENSSPVTLSITVDQFNDIVMPLLNKTIESCKEALKIANLKITQIDRIIMVGGSTRVPLVKKMVGQFFNQTVFDDVNPDEVVALGAAIQANVLAGNIKDVLLLDVTPLSLGIETIGGLMDVLVPRNSKIPTRMARNYTTSKDGQTQIKIAIYQGERDLIQDNRKLADFTLKGIPAMPAGLPKLEIQFWLDADGILKVKATELRSGVEQEIEVVPQYGLTDTEVEKMLVASIENAQKDMDDRALIEATNEANMLIITTQNFLIKNRELFSEEEVAITNIKIESLNNAVLAKSKNEINLAQTDLNNYTKPFAEKLMDTAISKALQGKNI
jgi:molecular chaperone HscA